MLLAHTFSPAGVKSDSLGIGRLMFSKRDIVADVRYYAVGPDFVPEMGFVTQNDLRRSSVDAGDTQWINRKRVRNVIYSGSLVYDAFYDHAFLGRRGAIGSELTLESNDRVGYSYAPVRERISVPFSIGPITIQPGDYSNRSHEVSFESNASRAVSGIVNYSLIDAKWTYKFRF